MNLARGQRDKLSKYINPAEDIILEMAISGPGVYDYSCFGVDAASKLSDERYMIFYNQTTSPNNEIRYSATANSAQFTLNLSALPATIDKLIFTVSIDGAGTMGLISKHSATISQNGSPALYLELTGRDFTMEKAIITIELYRKGEWRFNAVSQGFNGGLSALLAAYGGVEMSATPQPAPAPAAPAIQANVTAAPKQAIQANIAAPAAPAIQANVAAAPKQAIQANVATPATPAIQANVAAAPKQAIQANVAAVAAVAATVPAPAPATVPVSLKKNEEQLTKSLMNKISLSKDKVKLEKHVVSLSKTVVSLSKKSGVDLGSMRAKVVVALDYSGSMNRLYENGTVQRTLNKLVPLGLNFDDNGSIDVYLFQNDYRKIEDLDLSNYETYVKEVINNAGYHMGGTNYAPVLRAIIQGETRNIGGFLGFGGKPTTFDAIVDNDGDPTFILFITDGENWDKKESNDIIRFSSEMNVFIQFIGIGNEDFKYLRNLDDMPGRRRDNTGFSAMRDLNQVSDEELYTNVLEQFSLWLKGMQ